MPLLLQIKRVIYTASEHFQSDAFEYTVQHPTGATATARVVILPFVFQAPQAVDLHSSEDSPAILTLGGVSPDGVVADTIIASLPDRGTLYEVSLQEGRGNTYKVRARFSTDETWDMCIPIYSKFEGWYLAHKGGQRLVRQRVVLAAM